MSYSVESVPPAAFEVKAFGDDHLAEQSQEYMRGSFVDLAEMVYDFHPSGSIRTEPPKGFGLTAECAQNESVVQKRARRRKSFVMQVSSALTLVVS